MTESRFTKLLSNRSVPCAIEQQTRESIWPLPRGFDPMIGKKTIFDEKWQGKRAVLSDDDSLLDRSEFEDSEWLDRILRFSALPGTSRHHWGTDIDVYDRAALSAGQRPALCPPSIKRKVYLLVWGSGYRSTWRDDNAEGFFRPYDVDTGGVSVEPWHLSFRPTAERFAEK